MKYLPGYSKAIEAVGTMDREALVEHMSHLWGTERLSFDASLEDIRREAVRQTKLDFLDATAEDYKQSRKMLENR